MKTVIMAAGFGSRLWPLSTSERPKQFLRLVENESLISYTYRNLLKAIPGNELYILILEGMQELVRQEIPEIADSQLIVVPERRNTLPHTMWALRAIAEADEPVLFKSVDHFIVDTEAFLASLTDCIDQYNSTETTLLGSKFSVFNSNDGYLAVDDSGIVAEFIEKPDQAMFDTAKQKYNMYRAPFLYITTKFSLSKLVDDVQEPWQTNAKQLLEGGDPKNSFLALPFIDISNEIFAKSHSLQFAEVSYDFVDVGRFEEIYKLNTKDSNGNVIVGESVILDGDCNNNLIVNDSNQPLVVISRSDTVIVQTDHGSLVSSFQEAKRIGDIYKKQIHI